MHNMVFREYFESIKQLPEIEQTLLLTKKFMGF